MKHKFLNLLLLPLPAMAGVAGLASCTTIDRMADRDYDGIPDAIDEKPDDGTVTFRYYDYISVEDDISADTSYTMDYRYFVDLDPEQYHQEIAQMCMPLLTNAYMFMDVQYKTSNGEYISSTWQPNFLEHVGIWDVENIDLYQDTYLYDDCDLIYAKIGHHEFIYKDKKYQVFFIPIRGTTSLTEAVSDFDVGYPGKPYIVSDRETEHPDWKNPDHHKGFDVTANRVMAKAKDYINRYKQEGFETIVVPTGHSRGASVANLLGKQFTDENIKNFTYCIAPAPVTFGTIPEGKYKNIINIVSDHDIVPDIQTKDESFKRYGVDVRGDIAKWKEDYYNFMPGWSPDFLDPKYVTDFWKSELTSRADIYKVPVASSATDDDDYYKYATSSRDQAETAMYTIKHRFNEVYPGLGRFADFSPIKEDGAEGEEYYFYVTTSLGFLIETMSIGLTEPLDAFDCIRYMKRFFRLGIIPGLAYKEGFAAGTIMRGFDMGYRNLIMMHLPPTYQVIVDHKTSAA